MGLAANPDFQAWLAGYAERHRALYAGGPVPPAGVCDGCGDALPEPPSATPYCLVCLAEQYGRERAGAAGRVAAALRAALMREPSVAVGDVREAVEEVLEDCERGRLEAIA